MRMVDLIVKKRDGQELTREEIHFWIKNYVNGNIPDYQSSAMTMAIVFKGMTDKEVVILTDEMEHSGAILDLSPIKGIKLDKHSTGGVGDKTSLVLGPMVASCGAVLAKLSGRGLGHTGGTLDKLESIPGLTISIEGQRFVDQVNNIGIAIAGQTKSLVPADKKLYALRDVTGTVESIPLIASSVMSKKLACGTDAILLEVTVGEGAFMKNIEDARKLAKLMVSIGNSLNRDTRAVITNMNEPLGNTIGNSIEVKEAIEALKGNGPEDLMELCYTAGSIMLVQSHIAKNKEEALKMLKDSIISGRALNKFIEMVKAQGGDIEYILHPEKFEMSSKKIEIRADKEGYIKEINALSIGVDAMKLGAGRETVDDQIDMSAGIIINKKVGDHVKPNELLCTAYTNKENISDIIWDIRNTFKIVSEEVKHIPVVLEIIE